MKFRWEKKYLYWGITAFLVIAASILFYLCLSHLSRVAKGIRFVLDLLMPFVLGGIFAYLLEPLVKWFEEKCFSPLWKKIRKGKGGVRFPRAIAIAVSIILALALVAGLLYMVIPQLIESIRGIIEGMPTYLSNLESWLSGHTEFNPELEALLSEQFTNIESELIDWARNNLLPRLDQVINHLTSGVKGVLGGVLDFLVGVVIAIYILASQEHFFAQAKKITYSLFSVKLSNRLVHLTRRADRMFGGFIKGKLIDSFIIGVLCFIAMSIFKMPFALLVSVIVGVTNVIPFFGPFIGAIPSALLILTVNPIQAFWFIIFIIALQQFDGNILGPSILGDSTGLSAFWVIFAITFFGGLFGVAGMLFGVPLFALIYSIIAEVVDASLKRRELPVETKEYGDIDYIDAEHEPVYREDVDDVKLAVFSKKTIAEEESPQNDKK